MKFIHRKSKFNMIRRFKFALYLRVFFLFIIISSIIFYQKISSAPEPSNDPVIHHKSLIYNLSDPFIMTNLIDQFLNIDNSKERNDIWKLLIQSWLKSFQNFLKRIENLCLNSDDFIRQYLDKYTNNLLLNNNIQTQLTGFGLYFDYYPKKIHSKNHHIFSNIFHSSCDYFELILLIMKFQYILYELNINYFIGENTLIGAIRHHDIVPWHSTIEFNLPLNSKNKLIDNINNQFEFRIDKTNDTYIHKKQMNFIYKISLEDKPWPQIQIYFYEENSTHIYDTYYDEKLHIKIGYLNKRDVFPTHLRPFGPILLSSINNPSAMITTEKLNTCENSFWNYQLEKQTDINHQGRIACTTLSKIYSFVQLRYSWRRGYCEETLTTQRLPYKSLSYFRYSCREGIVNKKN